MTSTHSSTLSTALLTLALVATVACGGRSDSEEDTGAAEGGAGDTASSSDEGAAPVVTPAPMPGDAPLTAADLDAYERALTAEVAEVRKAVERRRTARTSEDTAAAMFAALDMQTQPAAAQAAGIPVERYRYLSDVLGGAISARKMNPAMANMATAADTSALASMPPEAQERMRQNIRDMQALTSDSVIYRDIPPELREQFKRRASTRLDTLWAELFALRARAAGMAK